jgi:aminopeptidase YwaD
MSSVARHIFENLSGDNAKRITAEITRYHRPPGGSGYHAATNLVTNELRNYGLDVSIETYPLDGKTVAGEGPLPLAWEPIGATIEVRSPTQEHVVDMRETTSCLAWWSKPTPPGGVEAELIDVGTGESEADFEGKDVAGKIVLIGHTERPGGWNHAARLAMDRGAIGLISDYLYYGFEPYRTRTGLPEAVQLLRLPNQLGKYDAWACSIAYPAAQRLRQLLAVGPVHLHADIQCRIFEGSGQNVLATIPGSELPDESVYYIAHTSAATCPCANCAAGPALMVEVARMLNDAIKEGTIARPRRSIKFLFIIEGMGSRTYIDEHRPELDDVKTAFCLDSVGHDQAKLKSMLLFYRHPDSYPSFINDYFAGVMERAPGDATWVFANDTDLNPVQFHQAPYTPWSDNHTWAAHGVPSPLIMSWPDLYFHTQLLTADNTDPRVFRRTGITTALAAYEIANAGFNEALIIASEVAARSQLRLETTANQAASEILAGDDAAGVAGYAKARLAYFATRDAANVAAAVSLVPPDAASEFNARIKAHQEAIEATRDRAVARVDDALAATNGGS